MGFHVGDKVIHVSYGLGEIVEIEEKVIGGNPTNCYVVRAQDMLIWIPINDHQQSSLRSPASPEAFEAFFAILTSPGEKLQEDRMLRKSQLMEQLKDGQVESLCRVVRDLTHYKRSAKLSDQERSILERAINSLVAEWAYSLGVPVSQAHAAMTARLGE
jgi:RNA polymerase-interacting CarD/CdnL/TRCF family regulator